MLVKKVILPTAFLKSVTTSLLKEFANAKIAQALKMKGAINSLEDGISPVRSEAFKNRWASE